MFGSAKRIAGIATAVAAAFALTTGVATAGVRFSDGTYASVHFDCKSGMRTIDAIPDFGVNTTDAYYTYTRYFSSSRTFSPWAGYSTMSNQAYGNPVSTAVHPGWFALKVHYAKIVNGRWESGDEWATVELNGTGGYWCYMA
jgi:hypothetical protein